MVARQMINIRGGRKKPGLMRQHLTCVKASAKISQAKVEGAEMLSTELEFKPNKTMPGDYSFAIGSAGSSTLVFQTLLPTLIFTDSASTLRISGGTHNPMAPSADYLSNIFLPLVQKIGVSAKLTCERVGFAPAGGGLLYAEIMPSKLKRGDFLERGELISREISAMAADLPGEIMLRESSHASKRLGWTDHEEKLTQLSRKQSQGAGNAFAVQLNYEHISDRFTHYASQGVRAERVAGNVVKEVKEYLNEPRAALGEHLADQALLPIALAGSGSFTTFRLTNHLHTNIAVIQKFLKRQVKIEDIDTHLIKISIS